MTRVSQLTAIENARANDNNKSPKKNGEDLDIDAAPANTDGSRDERKSKAAGE